MKAGLRLATVSVRYLVNGVDAATAFYCRYLVRLALSAARGQGRRRQSMSGGTEPRPGDWNRFAPDVADLGPIVEVLRREGPTSATTSSSGLAAGRS